MKEVKRMTNWDRLKIRLEEDKTSAINAREVAENTHYHELFYFFKGKVNTIAEILRVMEEIEGDNNGNY
jgi:hypothetical protein